MDKSAEEEHFRKARNSVFRLLKLRLRSEEELREKLIAKNLPSPIIEQTLNYFKSLSLIDDRRFAQEWTSSRLKRPFGINRIRLELKKKGVSATIIDETLEAATQQYDELAILTQLAQHRASKYKNIPFEKVQQRVYGYLLRRGFNTNTIIKAVKNL